MDQALTKVSTLGLLIHITELDVNGDQRSQCNTSGDVAANASGTQGGLATNADKKTG